MKKILLISSISLILSVPCFANSEYMKGEKPADVRVNDKQTADRSKLIVNEPKAKEETVETEPYVRKDNYVVTYESTVGGENDLNQTATKECEHTVVHQQVNTVHGTTYVPVQVPVNNQNSKVMRGKSTYRIVTRQGD